MIRSVIACAVFLTSSIVGISSAALINANVPENAYITKNGYDIAWISPVDEDYSVDMSYQSQFGWQIMTLEMFNFLDIEAQDFIKEGANVDYVTGNNLDEVSGAILDYVVSETPNNDVAIAVPYFSSSYVHADWSNGADGLWNVIGDAFHYETLAFRESAASVPEPSTISLLGIGLFALFLRRKRDIKKS
jgi:hypothetical protein